MQFHLSYAEIIERIASIDPVNYGRTRNYLNGAVTYLSPFISRGVISVKQVMDSVLSRGFKPYQVEKFLQELAWREYFQRVWQEKGYLLWADLKQPQPGVRHRLMVKAIEDAQTGIEAIDEQINILYTSGYMHNHVRMYVASITCNIAGAHWEQPARWLYYHLLDGDIASNNCSWQWVSGAFSSKKYYCNQENINKYTSSRQRATFLDHDYGSIAAMTPPSILLDTTITNFVTKLPRAEVLHLDPSKPTLVYNSYNLDPMWRKDLDANRVLLLEPSHFSAFPVSKNVMDFIMHLAKNISGLQVYVGEYTDLLNLYAGTHNAIQMLIHKEHPAFRHYRGIQDEREWMFPTVTGYHPSFFAYWKKCEKALASGNFHN